MGCAIRYQIVSIIFLFSQVFSFLDIIELSSFQYNIDISNQPVVLDESKEDGILLSSKHGQKYQCLFESASQFSQKVKEEEENASKISVPELLQPLEERPCLVLTTGWWTYEFCYKKHIKQYHVSEQKVVGDIVNLGSFSEEFDWNVTREKKAPEMTNRYHTQQYVNGSLCDLTGTMRSAEVRFKCKEGVLDIIEGVEEPMTCKYLVQVSTSRLCKHPSLMPLANKKSFPITCSPVLNESDYKEYLVYQKKLEEEKELEDAILKDKEATSDRGSPSSTTGTELEKSGDSDIEGGEFGYLDIGDTRIKFYVLSYDGANAIEGVKKEDKTGLDSAEKSTTEDDPSAAAISPSSSSLVTVESDSSENVVTEKTTLGGDEEEEEETSTDHFRETKEFLEIYKRILSNKKLTTFMKKNGPSELGVSGKLVKGGESETILEARRSNDEEAGDKVTGGEDLSTDRDDSGPDDGDAKVQDTDRLQDEVGEAEKQLEETPSEKRDAEDGESQETGQSTEVFTWKGSVPKSVSLNGIRINIRDPSGQDEEAKNEDVVGRKSSAPDGSGKDGDGEVAGKEMKEEDANEDTKSTSVAEAEHDFVEKKEEVQEMSELFKKGVVKMSEEHKSIHQMILAIVRQTDKNTKEMSRHEAIEKNYNFDWKKEQKMTKTKKVNRKIDEL